VIVDDHHLGEVRSAGDPGQRVIVIEVAAARFSALPTTTSAPGALWRARPTISGL
jgi:hypothetical protein